MCVSKALCRCGYSVVVFVVHKNVKVFFVFEDIDWKLGRLMYYDFQINIVRNNFFSKMGIFRLGYLYSHSNIFFFEFFLFLKI